MKKKIVNRYDVALLEKLSLYRNTWTLGVSDEVDERYSDNCDKSLQSVFSHAQQGNRANCE